MNYSVDCKVKCQNLKKKIIKKKKQYKDELMRDLCPSVIKIQERVFA